MCKCTPEIRTPWCGRPGCEAPPKPPPSNNDRIISEGRGEKWRAAAHVAIAFIRIAKKSGLAKSGEDCEAIFNAVATESGLSAHEKERAEILVMFAHGVYRASEAGEER